MSPLIEVRNGPTVSTEVTLNGKREASVRHWRTATDEVIDGGEVNLLNPKARDAWLQRLPADCQGEAAGHLAWCADRLIVCRQEQAENRPPPAPELPPAPPVDSTALYDSLVAALERYLVLAEGSPAYCALVLWIMLSHVFDRFDYSPLLLVTGPTARCGKSRVLDLLRHLAREPKPSVNLTDAVLFRVVDERHPTLLIDEADNIQWKERGPLLSLINGGFFKESAKVDRCVGEGQDTKAGEFDVFAPKAIAGKRILAHLPDTTVSRSVVITMRRRLRSERQARYRER